MRQVGLFLLIILIATSVASTLTQDVVQKAAVSFGDFFSPNEVLFATSSATFLAAGFVGDVMLARRVETYLDSYGNDYVYSELPSMSSTTILVGNFEAAIPLEHIQTPDLTFSFSVDAEVVPSLARYGFSYMSLANNHSFDKGATDFLQTQKILNQNAIKTFGDPLQFGTSSISYFSLSSTSVALVGFQAIDKEPTSKELELIMNEASLLSDFQIAYMHWGNEYEPVHSLRQQTLARKLVDAGFDTVIGSHPHVVQDIESYKDVLIFYSLGNFIFDQYFSEEVQTGLWVELEFEGSSPVYTLRGVTSVGSRSRPRLMAEYENDIFLSTLAKKSSPTLTEMIQKGFVQP